jgi:hypothetical protein
MSGGISPLPLTPSWLVQGPLSLCLYHAGGRSDLPPVVAHQLLKYSDILNVEVLGIPQLGYAPRKVQP